MKHAQDYLDLSPVAPGGAVLALAPDARGRLWLAAEGGLWRGLPGAFVPVASPPLARVNALLALGAGPTLVAGGAPAGIFYSPDEGATWYAARSDEVEAAVTCLAASPRFAEDATLLAGTAGAGILRSTDGGRSWRLSNAGLHEFLVLALATAPAWGEREVVFALTEGGLYRSPNGGRYWRRVADGGDDLSLQSLAVSPGFADDGLAYAAGDLAGPLRSEDGGATWGRLPSGGEGPAGVNCLLAAPGGALLAGTLDGAIYRSADGGGRWDAVAAGSSSALALGAWGETLAAGMLDEGLLLSHDGGATWAPQAGLAVRDLTRLALAADGAPLAYGPSGGIWRAEGAGWRRLAVELDAPLMVLLPKPDSALLVGTSEGLIRLAGDAAAAEPFPGEAAATALAAHRGVEWLGDAAGALWRRAPGEAWSCAATIAAGRPVVAIAPAGQDTLLAATLDPGAGRATLWRSVDGVHWTPWLEDQAAGQRVSLGPGASLRVALGSRVWRWDGAAWASDEPDGAPVAALVQAPGGALIAATAAGAYARSGAGWVRLALEPPPGGLLDLVALPSGRLLGLGRGGRLAPGGL